MADKVSKYFTYAETVKSALAERLGIDNTPPSELRSVIQSTAWKLDIVRECLNSPITVDSWYRCAALNDALGSKRTSQHVKGEAVDFVAPAFGTPVQIAKRLISQFLLLQYDQLIYEHSWIHISFQSNPQLRPRGSVLTLDKSNPNRGYLQGIVEQ